MEGRCWWDETIAELRKCGTAELLELRNRRAKNNNSAIPHFGSSAIKAAAPPLVASKLVPNAIPRRHRAAGCARAVPGTGARPCTAKRRREHAQGARAARPDDCHDGRPGVAHAARLHLGRPHLRFFARRERRRRALLALLEVARQGA